MHWCLYLVALLFTPLLSHAVELQEVYPGIYFIHNAAYGIHAYNYFTVLNYEFRYNAIFINGRQLPKCKVIDNDHNQLALENLRQLDEHNETYMRTYKFPVLSEGNHKLVIAYCDERDEDGAAEPLAQIEVEVICKPMQLLFYPGTPPCLCHFDTETSRLLDRSEWVGEKK